MPKSPKTTCSLHEECFVAVEIQTHGSVFFNHDHIGSIAAFDRDIDFLHARDVNLRRGAFALAELIPKRQNDD